MTEFKLINLIKSKIKNKSKDVIVGIGDDTAVLKYNKTHYQIITTDTLVENIHFSNYFTPQQIGKKAIEQNVSDIAAMGGIPKFATISLGLKKNDKNFTKKLYDGIISTSKKYKIEIVGGNITKSKNIFITISLIGLVKKNKLTLRSNAKTGDLIFVSGNLGSSKTGFEILKKSQQKLTKNSKNKINKKIANNRSIKSHLEPKSRLELSKKLTNIGINSMIDISDGLISEIKHICNSSNKGAEIYLEKIPISKSTINDCKKIKKDPLNFALTGGEDFELLFTANKNKLSKLKKLDVTCIGKINNNKKIKFLETTNGKNKIVKLKNNYFGFDHF